jgi:signal transduction protein with GAF and PtsI domain
MANQPVAPDGAALNQWAGAGDLPRLIARQLVAIRPLLAAAACSVALLDDERQLTFVAASGIGADAIVGQRIAHDRGIAGWVVSTGQAIGISDIAKDARFAHDVAESTGYVPSRITAVPVLGDVAALGVLEVLDADHDHLGSTAGTAAMNGLAESVADLVASVGEQRRDDAGMQALSRIGDADPDLARHVEAVLAALAPIRGGRRR